MSDQIKTKKVTWQDLEVAEETPTSCNEIGNAVPDEPITTDPADLPQWRSEWGAVRVNQPLTAEEVTAMREAVSRFYDAIAAARVWKVEVFNAWAADVAIAMRPAVDRLNEVWDSIPQEQRDDLLNGNWESAEEEESLEDLPLESILPLCAFVLNPYNTSMENLQTSLKMPLSTFAILAGHGNTDVVEAITQISPKVNQYVQLNGWESAMNAIHVIVPNHLLGVSGYCTPSRDGILTRSD